MAGIFPDSSSIRPWIQADVFVFSEGVPEDPSQVQTLGTTLPSPSCALRGLPPLPQEVTVCGHPDGPLGRGNSLELVVREGGPQMPYSPSSGLECMVPFLQLTLPFSAHFPQRTA